ncbi:hypothetical protein AMJ57_00415 [Parcubacteria bacterium SG8_24]|nr:MAG: hypothetical protein AMJ57_00415 [Parcubacteria bacterium SG8_24]
MNLVLRIVGGIVLMGIGSLLVIKTKWFLENFGRIDWAEQKLGSGGTWMFYKLLGIIIIFAGMMMATGLLGGFLLGTVGRLFTP